MLYWNIGNIVKEAIIKEKRAEYGKQVVEELSWSHIRALIYSFIIDRGKG